MTQTLPYLANCSMLFTELPLLERPAAARAAGFDAIEFWWPFAASVPSDREVDDFIGAVRDAGVALVGLNFFAGDLAGADAGRAVDPGAQPGVPRQHRRRPSASAARCGRRAFNALYGVRVEDVAPAEQDALATENLVLAAQAAEAIGATVLIEALSGPKPYPLRTADDAVAVVDRVRAAGPANVGFLCDLFHLANNGDDIDAAIAAHQRERSRTSRSPTLPGRGEPGSGALDLDGYLERLQSGGYARLGRPGVQADRRRRSEPGLAAARTTRRARANGAA